MLSYISAGAEVGCGHCGASSPFRAPFVAMTMVAFGRRTPSVGSWSLYGTVYDAIEMLQMADCFCEITYDGYEGVLMEASGQGIRPAFTR